MLLLELISKEAAALQIAQFIGTWGMGRYHWGKSSAQLPPTIFSLIRHFFPEASYHGPTYRAMIFNEKQILASKNTNDLIRMVVEFQHPNKSQFFAWSSSPQGIRDWMGYEEHGDDGMPAGSFELQLYVRQQTSYGIDAGKLVTALEQYPEVKERSNIILAYRAAEVNEVLAPFEPPLEPIELILSHPGQPQYYDPETDEITDEPTEHPFYPSEESSFRPAEFGQMKKMVQQIQKQGWVPARGTPKKFGFNTTKLQ